MPDIFISYSRKDRDFALKLRDRLADQKREAWIDLRDIPPTAEWWKEICANIEAADNFMFVVSPDSCVSDTCKQEVAYAESNHKRMIPVVCRPVSSRDVPPALARIQWISFTDGAFEASLRSLIQALDTDLDWVRLHRRLLVRALEWDRSGRDNAFLLRGMDLQNAMQWLAQASVKEPAAAAIQKEYIRASQVWESGENERLRKQARKLRRRATALAVMVVLALGAAALAFWQGAVSRARQLVAMSILAEPADPELSLLIAAQSVAATWPVGHTVLSESEQQLHQAMMASHVRLTLAGHSGEVRSVAWSPDGKRLATGSADKTAKVWDTDTGQELLTLSGHSDAVSSVAWRPDGKRLATGSTDKTAKVWDLDTGQELLTLSGHSGPVTTVAWSPDGNRLATGSADMMAKVWDAKTGQELLNLSGNSGPIQTLAWSPDGKLLATGAGSGTLNPLARTQVLDKPARVWDAETGKELLTLSGQDGPVGSIAWSPAGKRLATGSGSITLDWLVLGGIVDKTAKLWDAETGKELLTLSGHNGPVTSVAWSPGGGRLATGAGAGTFDSLMGIEVLDKTAKVWDAETGKELLTLTGHSSEVLSVAWSPDGKRLATGSADKTAKVWEPEIGREFLTLTGHSGPVKSVAWSPDGKRLATASGTLTVENLLENGFGDTTVWDAETGGELLTLKGHSNESVAWSPDGKRLATGSADGTVKVTDAENDRVLLTLSGHTGPVYSVAWSSDGTLLATGSGDQRAKIWDVETGKEILTLSEPKGHVTSVAWSPDGKRLATGNDLDTAKVWDPKTGRELLNLSGYYGAGSVAWSPDGKRLATAGFADNTARVWNAGTGKELLSLSGHAGEVYSVAWSPDGKLLATGSKDQMVMVWDAGTGQKLLTLSGHSSYISSVAWSPDGKRLAAGSDDNTVQIYVTDIRDLIALAQQRVTTQPSKEGCKKYLYVDKCPAVPNLGRYF